MIISWTVLAWESYFYWRTTDKKTLKRINELIKDIKLRPFEGIGKPEGLRFDLVGKWPRRINEEHRLVHEIKNREIIIYQCRYHY